ncbi:nucleolar protein dao-5-like isoform X2 [Pieris napi]|uniref:nucleolar protein dao-5-like isoform X2 n=1 Tax=Pieris napi TaxID=78633 RepID=UPI001FBB5F67|nr:nucleolar protein dao-5-like isoform X2 [Pieris napi]
MAPSPEYDKEPKAPDKAVVNISSDDSKIQYNHTKEHSSASELRSSTAPSNSDVENKIVESLDDGQLRALLDEAITYKCPKDREGKSSLFKELLEEVEQDEEACEAAARAGRAGRRDHHSSLQDLVAAMAAEPAPRRRHHHSHNVSARTHHGGSLPSGVDRSFLFSEEPTRGAYVATVRCVNPPPLAERRVSASDANGPGDIELVTRRSKPMFPMTYTARATLEIGSGSVGTGRAVTTTTASNQVRTTTPRSNRDLPTAGPPQRRLDTPALYDPYAGQNKLMKALCVREESPCDSGGNVRKEAPGGKEPRGSDAKETETVDVEWNRRVDMWYESLKRYTPPLDYLGVQLDENESKDRSAKLKAVDSDNKNINNVNENNSPNVDKSFKDTSRNKLDSRDRVLHLSDCEESDISLRRLQKVGSGLVTPNLSKIINPRNIRNMTIQNADSFEDLNEDCDAKDNIVLKSSSTKKSKKRCQVKDKKNKSDESPIIQTTKVCLEPIKKNDTLTSNISTCTPSQKKKGNSEKGKDQEKEMKNKVLDESSSCTLNNDLKELEFLKINKTDTNLESGKIKPANACENRSCSEERSEEVHQLVANEYEKESNINLASSEDNFEPISKENTHSASQEHQDFENKFIDSNISGNSPSKSSSDEVITSITEQKLVDSAENKLGHDILYQLRKKYGISETKTAPDAADKHDKIFSKNDDNKPFDFADSCIFLSIRESLLKSRYFINHPANKITEGDNAKETSVEKKSKKKNKQKDKENPGPDKNNASKKNALKYLLYSDCTTNKAKEKSAIANKIDSAIPFSCITTPEVVASCNTTSTTQSTVVVDPKLESCYNAVASLTGSPPAPAADATSASAPHALQLSRNVLPTSSLGGLLLASESCPSADENKKSLDENGNAVHGFSSPASGSSQQKKPRRKKSSKNETVIKSHQIDGYQGNKDLNEVLRFIESNADGARGSKARAKHKDDSDDKGKKRCADRRKDKESKVKRASSLEERSRTKLEDLTDKPSAHRRPAAPPAKPERRSWGDDARAALLLPDDAELTDFQTVTKRRKPRRRPDDAEPARPPPSPEPRASPSERSNDSNDDFDSAHSPPPAPVPAPPPPPPPPALPPPHPPASYADIARTRNNIPDLIESCNFYAEGDEPKEQPAPDRKAAAPAGEAMEGYPALAVRRPRDKAGGGATRPQRKERGEARAAEPAPDVVADRRPPVILLAAAARAHGDMEGITFGFDVNEQLLSGGRRARCDLLEGVPVRAGCAALRYVPPAPLPHATHTHQIVDYVGTAWEDIIRCSNGKVRYFSE